MKIRFSLTWVMMVTILQWCGPLTVAGDSTHRSPLRVSSNDSLRRIIFNSASNQGVDPGLVEAIVAVESAFNPTAVSVKGAMGLMQLMPQTAVRYGVADPFDPKQNVHGGIRYLRDLLLRFENLLHALAAYNAGEGAVLRYQGLPPYPETHAYVRKVLERYGPGRNPIASSSVLFVGQSAGETIRALGWAKRRYQESATSSERRNTPFNGRSLESFIRPRSPNPRPLTQFSIRSLVETIPLPRNSVEFRVHHRQ